MAPADHSAFRKSLFDPHQFTLTFELVPSRGGWSKGQSRLLAFAEAAAADGRLQAVSITENAGGHPALSPEVLGLEIRKMGLEVINHFSCKDKNRNQMESQLFGWDRQGFQNLLVITGDYPRQGYLGKPKPVFDLDCVHVLGMINKMNQGHFESCPHQPQLEFKPTSFLKAVAISPFKILPSELRLQYAKLHRKLAAGADYLITQLGFDARKFHEVLLYLRENQLSVPILGNVFIPNLPVIELMYRGKVPGCIIPEKLYQAFQAEARSADQGKRARLLRAAKLLAILKGLGYSGAHIGGPALTFADLDLVLTAADRMQSNWRQLTADLSFWPAEGSYYFARDSATGLNLPQPLPHQEKTPLHCQLSYRFSEQIHNLCFQPDGRFFQQAKKVCLSLDRHGQANLLMQVEHLLKLLLLNCKNCGDCRIAQLAYLCPQSGCAKYLLNGACGGSLNGWCEVYPGRKRCFYVKVYERLKACEQLECLKMDLLPPRDWALNNSSSWLNFFKKMDKPENNS